MSKTESNREFTAIRFISGLSSFLPSGVLARRILDMNPGVGLNSRGGSKNYDIYGTRNHPGLDPDYGTNEYCQSGQ